MRVRTILLPALFALAAIGGWALLRPLEQAPVAPAPVPAQTSQPAATGRFQPLDPAVHMLEVDLIDGDGGKVDLAPYRGRVLLVNFWATWCPPCVAELPSLAKLQEVRGGEDFAVLPIAIDERDPAKVAAFLARHGIELPAIIDVDRSMDSILRISALPTSLLVDQDGMARAMFLGDTRWDCGKPLQAVEDFIATGAVSAETLEPCP